VAVHVLLNEDDTLSRTATAITIFGAGDSSGQCAQRADRAENGYSEDHLQGELHNPRVARDVRDLAQLLIQHWKAGNDNRIHDAERDLQEQVLALLKANPLLISAKRRDNEWTPLHVAAAHGHVKIAEMLFEHKADVDARTNMGYTPLQLALANDKGIVIGPLCAHGANVNAKSNDGGWSGPQF
jgi:ankyrin repeat protein